MLGRGEIVGDRFEVLGHAGTGGVGVVYEAVDRQTGQSVALKLIDGHGDPRSLSRFQREAEMLEAVQHPRIVRHVAHGTTGDGRRYLVMEWLSGRDLARRLAAGGLSREESVRLGRHVAEALGHAHAAGVIHRDVKPSNLFLVDDEVDRVKLLDFGVARAHGRSDVTLAGTRVGTPAYMSPEQARGLPRLDARVDVFALGAVLYQCLTGRRAFEADEPLALLGKILLAEPEPVCELAPAVPPALGELVERMLSKAPEDRPRDGAAVAAELDALLHLVGDDATRAPPRAPEALTGKERRLLCLVVARDAADRAEAVGLPALAASMKARYEPLADGSALVSLAGSAAATDLAAQAARVALAIKHRLPDVSVALATGRGVVVADRLPAGDLIDRAAHELRAIEDIDRTVTQAPMPDMATGTGEVRLDETTAGLLDARFEIGGDAAGLVLRGERPPLEARTLLGQATPCVGREAELGALVAAYRACVDESAARAVLVTAPAGVGKTRLRHELLRRLAAERDPPEVLLARGDPMSAGAPFGLLGEVVRASAGVLEGEALAVQRRKLRARVGRQLADADAARVAEFLGELAGVPFADDGRVQLRAARGDAMLMGDQMQRAWEDFTAAEARARPLVLVLEDLHWGDSPTVAYAGRALRALRNAPLLVLALARPEVHAVFPGLWAQHGPHEIRLGELSRKASERLVRQVLGAPAADDQVAGIVERAGGNAFYLEELIRAAAEGRQGLPETVLAMVQGRLESMEPDARRVLRAASVFGEVFWDGAVAALLGASGEEIGPWLDELARREVVTRRQVSRVDGQAELAFRHALVREAAYAMLTEADRALGHRLAARWLEGAGEPDALVLAEHLERGGEPERAVAWYRRAAEQALGGNDLGAVLARAGRGLACAQPDDPDAPALHLLVAEAHNWRAGFPEAERAAEAALALLPPGSELWHAAAGELAFAAGVQGHRERLTRLFEELWPHRGTGHRAVLAATMLVEQLVITGDASLADRLLVDLTRAAHELRGDRPGTVGRILSALATRSRYAGDVAAARELADDAVACYEQAGDVRSACVQRGRAGFALLTLGEHGAAERSLRDVLSASERMGLANVGATARHNLGLTLSRLGRHDEARTVERLAIDEFRASANRRLEGASLEYLAIIELGAGDFAAAEAAARAALAVATTPAPLPLNEAESLGILALALLERGALDEAHDAAARGVRLLEELGGIDDGEAIIRLVWAEVLQARGDATGARAAITAARTRLEERAGRITDGKLRRSFLENVPENARTLARAASWI